MSLTGIVLMDGAKTTYTALEIELAPLLLPLDVRLVSPRFPSLFLPQHRTRLLAERPHACIDERESWMIGTESEKLMYERAATPAAVLTSVAVSSPRVPCAPKPQHETRPFEKRAESKRDHDEYNKGGKKNKTKIK
jgi:hypothetical protein